MQGKCRERDLQDKEIVFFRPCVVTVRRERRFRGAARQFRRARREANAPKSPTPLGQLVAIDPGVLIKKLRCADYYLIDS